MKKYLITLILLSIAFSGFSQDKKSMEERAAKMYSNIATANYDKLIDYTYPKLFEIVPKDLIRQAFKQMLEGTEEFQIEIINVPPNFSFEEIKKIGDGWYSLIKHDLKMKMIFKDKIEEDQEEFLLDMFKQAMETQDIVFDRKNNSIIINKRAEMIAVFDKYTNKEWTFVNKTKDPLMEKLFSPEVIKEYDL